MSYAQPTLRDGDRLSVLQPLNFPWPVVLVHHVCVGNGRLWSARQTLSRPGEPDVEDRHEAPVDITDTVHWDADEGIFVIN